jgi:DMSO/TMAO reductase YedYZ molybdopterin-dependent catalytic subunit
MARYELTGTVDSLHAELASLSRDREDGTRVAEFHVRAAPYTVTAEAVLPPMPDSAVLELRIRLDTIPVAVRVGCSNTIHGGVRAATVAAESPPWAKVNLRDVAQEAGVCSPARQVVWTSLSVSRRPRLVLGGGRVFGGRTSSWGAFAGIAFLTAG